MNKIIFLIAIFSINLFSQNNYYISLDNKNDFSSIKSLNNAKLSEGDIVNFKSGEKFSDETLICEKGVTYTTYGGEDRAIIGDLNIAGYSQTIYIDNEDVSLINLTINAYKGSKKAVEYRKGGLTISDCLIQGSPDSHLHYAVGIDLNSTNILTNPTLITRNEIRNFYKGLYFRMPYNLEVSYNKIHKMYKYDGYYGNGGDCLVGTKASGYTKSFDTKYTFHIHHNELFDYEHTAIWIGNISKVLFEYNEVHSNLDERLFMGGVKSGGIGKLWDNTGQPIGSLGHIIRYNYFHDIKRFGKPGYKYSRPTPEQIEKGEFIISSTNTGNENPIYSDAGNKDGGDYIGGIGNLMSGQGYGNYWIHNNLIYNVGLIILAKGRNYLKDNTSNPLADFNNNYRAYFVNNTIINCGEHSWLTDDNGLLMSEGTSQSPDFIVNNIIDHVSKTTRMAGRWKEKQLFLTNNIYLKQSGSTTNLPQLSDQIATYYQDGKNQNIAQTVKEYYKTNPDWNDPNSIYFASNIGPNGVQIPDVRLREGGNANKTGMDYKLIGDTYTVLSQKHTLGKDPTGKSFAYDLLGNLRTSNDIGALGAVLGNSTTPTTTNLTPIITDQPFNINANIGEQISFSVSATCDDEIGYQWWKSPFINTSESKITNNNKYSGVATNKLIINNITEEDSKIKYVCEVYNKKNHSSLWINTEPVSIIIQNTTQTKTNLLKVFLEAPYNNGKMNSTLSSSNDFPTSQPYNMKPWNLSENTEIQKELKSNYIDWMIVELRKENSQTSYRKTGVLTLEGNVVNQDGTNFSFDNIISGEYYIVLVHRNHLDIMSSSKVVVNSEEAVGYDFTYSQSSVFGIQPMTKMEDGRFAMYAGDADGNGIINNLDFGVVANKIPFKGYSRGDLDLNGIVNVLDYKKINENILKSSYVSK